MRVSRWHAGAKKRSRKREGVAQVRRRKKKKKKRKEEEKEEEEEKEKKEEEKKGEKIMASPFFFIFFFNFFFLLLLLLSLSPSHHLPVIFQFFLKKQKERLPLRVSVRVRLCCAHSVGGSLPPRCRAYSSNPHGGRLSRLEISLSPFSQGSPPLWGRCLTQETAQSYTLPPSTAHQRSLPKSCLAPGGS